jgi:hypothetical protein
MISTTSYGPLTFINVEFENAHRVFKFKPSKKGSNIRRASATEQTEYQCQWVASGKDVFDAVTFICDMMNIDYPTGETADDAELALNA